MTLPKQVRLDLLELMYAYSQALDGEKAEAQTALHAGLDQVVTGTRHTRQQVNDYLRKFYFQDFYRMKKRQERSEV